MCVDTKVVVIKGRKLMIPLPSETADKVRVAVDLVLYIGELSSLKSTITMLRDVGTILSKNQSKNQLKTNYLQKQTYYMYRILLFISFSCNSCTSLKL